MLLAGGQGNRLDTLTKRLAKPAIPFGGKYRIIDFTLSNCSNSDIETVGVLTQYKPLVLNSYIGNGEAWDLDRRYGGVYLLPPFFKEKGGEWYKGTADAVYQNLNFIDIFDPDYILVLSGDHVYKMDYTALLAYHKKVQAQTTIAVIEVPWCEASRFGIMNTDAAGRILMFNEKPKKPQSNLASMGIYIFNTSLLKQYLTNDAQNPLSSHDFGKNIIPKMLSDGKDLFAYPFQGYWKDVGTIRSYWEANMDLLNDNSQLQLSDPAWRISSVNYARPPHHIGRTASVIQSIIGEGCRIHGHIEHSVIFPDVDVNEGVIIKNSVIMPHAKIHKNAHIENAIIGTKVMMPEDTSIERHIQKDPQALVVISENSITEYSGLDRGFKTDINSLQSL